MAPKVSEAYKEEKRQTLLASALHCFAEQGFQATTIDDIVRHAGVSKGLLYTYFPSKEDMYLQLLEARTAQSLAEVQAAFERCDTAKDKLRWLMKRFRDVPLNEESRKFAAVQLEFWLYATRHPILRETLLRRYDGHIQLVLSIIQEGVAAGEFRTDVDLKEVAAVFWGLRDGISLHFIHVGSQEVYGRVCDVAESMLYRYLGVE